MIFDSMRCETFVARLGDYLEDEVDAGTRAAMEAHAAACPSCGPLVTDLRAIAAEASGLPTLRASRDLWDGIAARIEAPAIPLRDAGRQGARGGWFITRRWAAAAAAGLVLATAGITYAIARGGAGQPPAMAVAPEPRSDAPVSDTAAQAPSGLAAGAPATLAGDAGAGSRAAPASGQLPRSVAASPGAVALQASRVVEAAYDREILQLRGLLDERREELDPATVAILESSLKVIDEAIAQSRAALARDPASAFLVDRLNRSLDKKLDVLRIAATLPART